MRFGSVCSGIEAASVAWESLGWSAAWFAEIEAFPSAVLNHHWPEVPNLGDMTQIGEWVSNGFIEAPDVLVGGTPCQAFSVAGARKSLDDDRGQLSLEYIKLANAIDCVRGVGNESIIVWENVPGVLNTKDNAFGCFLGALAGEEHALVPSGNKWTNAGCVFGPQRSIAWRVLDAQHFGVAQRRRRVFVVASAREGFDPTQVLFEFDSMRRDTPPSREEKQDTPRGVGIGFAESSFGQYRECLTDSGTLKRSGGVLSGGSETFIVGTLDTQCGYEKAAFQSVVAGHIVVHGTQDPIVANDNAFPIGRNQGQESVVFTCATKDLAPTMRSLIKNKDGHLNGSHGLAVAFAENSRAEVRLEGGDGQRTGTLSTGGGKAGQGTPTIMYRGLVRRLTPIECERLQGFPDNHTRIPYRNKSADLCPDGPRYAACGNSMAVPVMHWIGKRIDSAVNTK